MSASYLSKVFRTEMNSTYSKYLVCLKISHAQKLLANSKLSVLEISLQTGFKNYNYFSDVFKKNVGCTPTGYRKRGGRTAQGGPQLLCTNNPHIALIERSYL